MTKAPSRKSKGGVRARKARGTGNEATLVPGQTANRDVVREMLDHATPQGWQAISEAQAHEKGRMLAGIKTYLGHGHENCLAWPYADGEQDMFVVGKTRKGEDKKRSAYEDFYDASPEGRKLREQLDEIRERMAAAATPELEKIRANLYSQRSRGIGWLKEANQIAYKIDAYKKAGFDVDIRPTTDLGGLERSPLMVSVKGDNRQVPAFFSVQNFVKADPEKGKSPGETAMGRGGYDPKAPMTFDTVRRAKKGVIGILRWLAANQGRNLSLLTAEEDVCENVFEHKDELFALIEAADRWQKGASKREAADRAVSRSAQRAEAL